MLFSEAVLSMLDRKCVARESWTTVNEEGVHQEYLAIMPGIETVWKVIKTPANVGNYLYKVDDFTATDWIVV